MLFISIPLGHFALTQFRIWKVRAAATIIWDGGGDGESWSDPLNWDTDAIPIDTDFVLIDTATTVKISSPTTITSLTLGSVTGNIASVLEFTYDSISTNSPIIIDGEDLTIYPAAIITHTAVSGETIVGKVNINITEGNANVYGSIDVSSKGYANGFGSGAGSMGNEGASGASHAGYGGDGRGRVGSSIIYGSMNEPTDLGSGGGCNYDNRGGQGGGAVKLAIGGDLVVNGSIKANGGNGLGGGGWHGSAGGSGGSIWINAGEISGSGSISANGGTAPDDSGDGGGGSGGRVAIYHTSNSISDSKITANGGKPLGLTVFTEWRITNQRGGAGTIYTKSSSQTSGSLRIDNVETGWSSDEKRYAITPIDNTLSLDSLIVKNYARVENNSTINTTDVEISGSGYFYNQNSSTTNYTDIDWSGGHLVDNGGTFSLLSGGGDLTIPSSSYLEINVPRTYTSVVVNGTLSHSMNETTAVNKLNLTVSGNFTINSLGLVDVSSKGFRYGSGSGAGTMGNGGSGGASHGGYGGNGKTRAGGVVTYGLVGSPTDLGSGGGCDYDKRGGQGGGAVKLAIGGDLVVNGDVLANGGNGVGGNGNGSGGGSGGSIWIDAGEISGSGSISAVIFIIFISFSVGLITGIYPAKRAKKISALNALRYE
jgi:hypothetical protein